MRNSKRHPFLPMYVRERAREILVLAFLPGGFKKCDGAGSLK